MTTIKELAKICGVSSSTVSKALNGYSDINPKTAEFIRQKAEELHYRPNAAARNLVTNRSYLIGVVYDPADGSGFRHEFFGTILNGIKEQLAKRGYDMIFLSKRVAGKDSTYAEHARYMSVDGVIVVACEDFHSVEIRQIGEIGIPMVTIDDTLPGYSSIMSDNIEGGYAIAKFLLDHGHRKIGVIHGEDNNVTKRRLNGVYRAFREYGIQTDPIYFRTGRFHSTEDATRLTVEFMNLPNPPTAIMYQDDFAFIGGYIRLVDQLGLRIPEDISVTGYDGIYMAQVISPKLTTYMQDGAKMGRTAVKKLLEHVELPDDSVTEQIIVTGYLLEGESVKTLENISE